MCWLVDGPAAGEKLMIKRAPLLLRVVRASGGEWDALDQLHDVPEPDEAITVYRRVGRPSTVHVDAAKYHGWFQIAEYRVIHPQPADQEIRSTTAWRRWAQAFARQEAPTHERT